MEHSRCTITEALAVPRGLAVCLALVEAESGDREVRAMGLTNGEFIEDVQEAGAILLNEWHTEDGQ